MDNKKVPKSPIIFECTVCNYKTQHSRDFEKHKMTAKHKKATDDNIFVLENTKTFNCNCGKSYKNRHNLSRHRNACKMDILRNQIDTSIIMEIMNDNKDFKALLIEQAEQHQKQVIDLQKENNTLMNKMVEITQNQLVVPTNITNNTTTNNNNQKFNLNFFLNETCKDAMNIQEFIENIKITFEDLLAIGNTGFVNGLSDIFMKQLKDLDVTKRPIHCTDSKRETIYLKANNEWSKDDKENKQLKDAIEKVEYKNVASLHQWCAENPDSKINNTPNNLLRDKIFLQTLQGDDKTRDKIIKNIVKEVVIDR